MPLLLLLGTNAIPFSVTVVIVIVVAVAIAVAVPVVAAASVASSRTNFSESEFFREEKKNWRRKFCPNFFGRSTLKKVDIEK